MEVSSCRFWEKFGIPRRGLLQCQAGIHCPNQVCSKESMAHRSSSAKSSTCILSRHIDKFIFVGTSYLACLRPSASNVLASAKIIVPLAERCLHTYWFKHHFGSPWSPLKVARIDGYTMRNARCSSDSLAPLLRRREEMALPRLRNATWAE